MGPHAVKVEIYSDIACSWCFIGKRRFERALAAFPRSEQVEVVYKPYQLVPDAPSEAVPHRAWLAERYGPQSRAMDDRVTALGRSEGISYDFDTALQVNTIHAHRLLWLAATEYGLPVQHRLKERLLSAHFAEGVDVGDFAALTAIAAAAGLDADRVAAFLPSDEGTAQVRAEMAGAHALGINSVPTFVFDGTWAVQGAQETSTFLQALEQAVPAAAPAGSCTDDSCAV